MSERGTPVKRRKTTSEVKLLQEAERSLLTEEDVGWTPTEMKNKELWLIQLPRDLDITQLKGQEIQLKGTEHVHIEGTEEKRSYSVSSYPLGNSVKTSPPIALLPSSKAGRLVIGPSFSGQAHVFQSVDVPPVELPTPGSKKQMEVPEGLRQRWKPFGWMDPPTVKNKKSSTSRHDHKHKKKSKKSHRTSKE